MASKQSELVALLTGAGIDRGVAGFISRQSGVDNMLRGMTTTEIKNMKLNLVLKSKSMSLSIRLQ